MNLNRHGLLPNMFLTPSLISLSNLVFCNISRNQFTILDVDFEKMDKLQHLIACFNQISEIPESLLKSSLDTLDLYGNKISSISLRTMNINLTRFDIAGNHISSDKFAEYCYLEQYKSLQSNLRSCNFEWEFLIKEKYSMDVSVLRERTELETAACLVKNDTFCHNSPYRNQDFSFNPIEICDQDPDGILDQKPSSLGSSTQKQVKNCDSQQFDDAD